MHLSKPFRYVGGLLKAIRMAKRQVGPITGKQVRLRLLEETDLSLTLAWRNQDHIRQWFVHSNIITWEEHTSWCAQYFQRDNDFIFIIEEITNLPQPIGQVSLYNIEWQRRRAEYGRLLIGESNAIGKGLAKEATALLLDYAFSCFGLQEIGLEVFSANAAAIAIYHAYGFREIGEHHGLKRMSKS